MDNQNLIEVEQLRKYYHIRDKLGRKTVLRALDGVSFGIRRSETLGIVGESGSGKTTLGRTILRLAEPDGGSIVYGGEDITHAKMRPYRSKMQIIFQELYGCLDPRYRVKDIVAEGLRVHKPDYSAAQRMDRVQELLETVGLTKACAYRYPHEFSGGQQQRIGIARALAVEPEFIVCDEPVSALDVSYQSQIINLLLEMREKRELTYLFISHDLAVVRHICDRIGVMYLGKLVECGASNDILINPAHPYTKALLEAVPVPDPKASRAKARILQDESADFGIPDKGCRYCNLCGYAEPRCFVEEPELKEVAPGHLCACHAVGF